MQVRTSADELRQAADVIAERLNQARGEWTFLVPLQGWSSLDRAGRPIHDPLADAAFVARLKQGLDQPQRVKELDLHLYTPEFARAAVDEFVRLFESVAGAGLTGGGHDRAQLDAGQPADHPPVRCWCRRPSSC